MRPILFEFGGIAVSSFWTMAFLGFFVSFLVVRSEIRRGGYDERYAYDIILWAYVGGWVGARLFVIPAGWQYFVEDPFAFLLSSSGWVWYGGVIGGATAVVLWAWHERFPLPVTADIAGLALAIGLGIGRIGCQLSGDGDYGVPTDLPWAMSYPDGTVPTTERVHPAPLYEMLGSFLIFGYLWRRRARSAPSGDLFGRYLMLAAVLRLLIEGVRRNPHWLFGLTTAQWFSLAAVAIGLLIIWRGRRAVSRGTPGAD